MTLVDITSIIGGLGQVIGDWSLGDDREFTGTVVGLPVSDPSFTDVYFTLKQNPVDIDSNSIVQKHITTVSTPAGQITNDGAGNATVLLVHVYAADYQVLVNSGNQFYWDFRGITTGGATITIAQGSVQFDQNVTQTNASGNPSNQPVLPRNGVPQFRGFISAIPTSIVGYQGPDNPGDWYRVLVPVLGQPFEFICTSGGVPGVWRNGPNL
jgi:hypothetical protein